jgi:hypothetical protein
MLPTAPAGFGRPASDRTYWSDAERRKRLANATAEAQRLLTADLPRWDDDAYHHDRDRLNRRANNHDVDAAITQLIGNCRLQVGALSFYLVD